MNGRRTLVGLALLSALALTAFAAPSVAQAGTGTTAFTCVAANPAGTGDWLDEHCSEPAGGTGNWEHEVIPVGQKTKIHSNSVLGKTITLSGTIATVKAKITCTGATGTGFLTNEEPSAGNHTLTGSATNISYTGCDMDVGKTEVTCSLVGGTVSVSAVKAMDVENAHGFGMGIKFEPEKGNVFASFETGSDCGSLANQSFSITGSALGVPHGATLQFTEASTKPTLSLGGNAASFEDTYTLRMINEATGALENPISVTTTGE
jgi:hypothetical protein